MEPVGQIQRIGLFGGTFDPIHNGHLAVADAARDLLKLDGVWFLPAAGPPHKIDSPVTSFLHRVSMLELAISGHPGFLVSPLEAELATPSFTIDTLRELKNRLGVLVALHFIIGIDAFVEIETWKAFSELTEYTNLVIIPRPSYSTHMVDDVIGRCFPQYQHNPTTCSWHHRLNKNTGAIQLLSKPLHPVSSSQVRAKLMAGRAVKDLIPDSVIGYIHQHHLYSPASF